MRSVEWQARQRAIAFIATGQDNERLTFSSSDNTVTSDAISPPNNVGTYTYTAGTGGGSGTLVITFPNGDNYNLNVTFTDATHGTWTGTQHFDNADHPVPGRVILYRRSLGLLSPEQVRPNSGLRKRPPARSDITMSSAWAPP